MVQEEISHNTTGEKTEQSLSALHERLKAVTEGNAVDPKEVERIQASIRNTIPRVDTGQALPQKKTPSGRTQVLHMNYKRDRPEKPVQAEMEHLRFFAQTSQELGLHLRILTHKNNRETIETELKTEKYKSLRYEITESQKPVSKWAEDNIEYLENGQVAVPSAFNNNLLEWAMTEGRKHRWQNKIPQEQLKAALRDDHLWIPLGVTVNADETSLEHERLAQKQGQTVGHLRAYIEGGNMITGEDATGNTVILIGKDTIDTTAVLFQINADDVKGIISEDFGLSNLDQIISVEQPGQFHLDMGMMFLGKGIVVVNDSQKALKDAIEMAEMVPCMTTETMAAKLQLQYELEEASAIDLKEAGLKVLREPLKDEVSYNFFNGEFVTDTDGFNYYITNGGPKEKQDEFEQLMVKDWAIVKKVIFSPQDAAQQSLQERGGVGCRLKGSQTKS